MIRPFQGSASAVTDNSIRLFCRVSPLTIEKMQQPEEEDDGV